MGKAVILLWLGALSSEEGLNKQHEAAGNDNGSTIDFLDSAGYRAPPAAVSMALASAGERRALRAWARSNLLTIVDARPAISTQTSAYDAALVAELEAELEQARTLSGVGDTKAALAQLVASIALLEQHPELPQAPWLLAEAYRQQATLAEKEDVEAAQRLRLLASGMDGSRAQSYTELSSAAPQLPLQQVSVEGLTRWDQLFIDGNQAASTLPLSTGLHHSRVVRDGQAIHSSWFTLSHGNRSVYLAPPPLVSCSLPDLTPLSVDAHRLSPPNSTRCPLWAVARPTASPGDKVEIALCQASRCQRFRVFSAPDELAPTNGTARQPESNWSPWLGYVAGGVGVVAATSLVLYASGAFDDPDPAGTRWRFGGVREPR